MCKETCGCKYAIGRCGIHAALLVGLATFMAGVGSASSFQNGNFETPVISAAFNLDCPGVLTGWIHTHNCATVSELLTASGNYGLSTLDGGRYISWGGNGNIGGAIEQTFDTIAGGAYSVNYLIAIQQNIGTVQSMKVEAFNGVTLLNSAAANNFIFPTFTPGPTLNFTATSTSTTLRFTDTTSLADSGPANWGLDTVTVTAPGTSSSVPETGTVTLVITGLGILLVSKRRRGIRTAA